VTRKTLACPRCGFTVRGVLEDAAAACRRDETAAVPARCPNGCGPIPDPDVPRVHRPLELDVERR